MVVGVLQFALPVYILLHLSLVFVSLTISNSFPIGLNSRSLRLIDSKLQCMAPVIKKLHEISLIIRIYLQ